MNAAAAMVMFFSVLFPARTWFPPSQPIQIAVKPDSGEVTLVLTDFAGKPFEAKSAPDVSAETTVNLREYWTTLDTPGTYILYAVPKGKDLKEFVGTPLVIGVRPEERGEPQPKAMVVKVEPLRYALMSTDKGDMTLAFYYDVAPNTVASFLSLAEGGFFDGLLFHRIVPNFVIQGGDPLGDSPDESRRGSGGPGYRIDAEFSDREHDVGVLSMAREGDPIEQGGGAMPRPEYADSAGSQFFICLTRERTKGLDKRYTVFGKATSGLDVLQAIGNTPVGGPNRTPQERREIRSVKVMPVTAKDNPYTGLLSVGGDPVKPE